MVDTDGDKFGKVDGLFLDHDEGKVRLLEVVDGGFLGLGKDSRLVPVELVRKVDADQVVIDRRRQAVVDAPGYDPELTDAPDDLTDIYKYYDVGPWWRARPPVRLTPA